MRALDALTFPAFNNDLSAAPTLRATHTPDAQSQPCSLSPSSTAFSSRAQTLPSSPFLPNFSLLSWPPSESGSRVSLTSPRSRSRPLQGAVPFSSQAQRICSLLMYSLDDRPIPSTTQPSSYSLLHTPSQPINPHQAFETATPRTFLPLPIALLRRHLCRLSRCWPSVWFFVNDTFLSNVEPLSQTTNRISGALGRSLHNYSAGYVLASLPVNVLKHVCS